MKFSFFRESGFLPPETGDGRLEITVILRRGTWALLVALLVTALGVPSVHAQRKKVVFGEEEEGSKVEGYVHRPEVGYIITRQEQEDLETLQLKESFVPKIVKSVDKSPF